MATTLYGGGYKGNYSERRPFTNTTGYEVGQIRSGNMVTAIVPVTKTTFNIYTVPITQKVNLVALVEGQARRENGQLNTYLTGYVTWKVSV